MFCSLPWFFFLFSSAFVSKILVIALGSSTLQGNIDFVMFNLEVNYSSESDLEESGGQQLFCSRPRAVPKLLPVFFFHSWGIRRKITGPETCFFVFAFVCLFFLKGNVQWGNCFGCTLSLLSTV